MKRVAVILVMLAASFAWALGKEKASVAVLSGYTRSAYEDQTRAQGAVPFGLQIGYMVIPGLQVGFEVNHLLSGLTWEKQYSSRYTQQYIYGQTIHSAYVRIYEGQGKVKLFYKGGVGYFMGDYKRIYKFNDDEEMYIRPIESGIGFTLGAGLSVNRIFLEFDYNIVSRAYGDMPGMMEDGPPEYDHEDKAGMNTWSVMMGYKINL
jgi:hypothetical protein